MTSWTLITVCFILVICHASGDGQKPIFDDTPFNVTAIKGEPAILPCSVSNKDKYLLVWMNPRRTVLSSNERRVIDDTRMSIERPLVKSWDLHIRNVKTSDAGEYTCQINTDPIQIKRIRLTVHVPAQIDNEASSENITVREGETVKLQCVASGIPEPSITWFRNTPQTNQTRQHVGTTGELLIIHNISRFCGGMYECEANNNIAQPARRAMTVDVAFPPEVSFRMPHRVSQAIGKEVMFECFVAAFPHGVGQWTKDGKPVTLGINHSWRYKTEMYKVNVYTFVITLRIINVEDFDFGTYTCEASNNLGVDSDTILFFELYKPTPPPTRRPEIPENIPELMTRRPPQKNELSGEVISYESSGAAGARVMTSSLLSSSIVMAVTLLRSLLPS